MVALPVVPKKLFTYIPASNILYNDLTLNDHIKFFSSEFKINKTEINAKINWFNQFFIIDDKLSRKIHSFTMGQLQYIKIFLSLLHSPIVLIIDELFTGLGTSDIDVLLKIFQELSQREVTILFTSSHLEYIRMLSEKTFSISDGIVKM